jgi:hypothetical protein
MIYHITVITGSAKFAGTDANVFIEIAGENGNTSVHQLFNPKTKREFERNQTNHFHVIIYFIFTCSVHLSFLI